MDKGINTKKNKTNHYFLKSFFYLAYQNNNNNIDIYFIVSVLINELRGHFTLKLN